MPPRPHRPKTRAGGQEQRARAAPPERDEGRTLQRPAFAGMTRERTIRRGGAAAQGYRTSRSSTVNIFDASARVA